MRKSNGNRIYPDGRKVDYRTGATTIVATVPLESLDKALHRRFLTLAEREQIADMHREGSSLRAIGRALGRPASTIKREIDNRAKDGTYRPYQAHRHWARSRPRSREGKLLRDGPLRVFVTDRLRLRWSPQQIWPPRCAPGAPAANPTDGPISARPGSWTRWS